MRLKKNLSLTVHHAPLRDRSPESQHNWHRRISWTIERIRSYLETCLWPISPRVQSRKKNLIQRCFSRTSKGSHRSNPSLPSFSSSSHTLSTCTARKALCKSLKFCMFSCSNLATNFTLFSDKEPRRTEKSFAACLFNESHYEQSISTATNPRERFSRALSTSSRYQSATMLPYLQNWLWNILVRLWNC